MISRHHLERIGGGSVVPLARAVLTRHPNVYPSIVAGIRKREVARTPAPRLLLGWVMKTQHLLVRGSLLMVVAGLVAASTGCTETVTYRRPAPAVVVYRAPAPAVVQERVIVR
jgi:hypothetical protein